jgi:hypothetical protein
VIFRSGGKGLVGRNHGVTPSAHASCLLGASDRIQEPLVAGGDLVPIAIQAGWGAREFGPESVKVIDRREEIPPVGFPGRSEPVAGHFFDPRQVGVANAALPEAGGHCGCGSGIANFEGSAGLDQPKPGESEAEFRHALLPGVKRFGSEQIPPGRIGLVLIELLGCPGAIGLHHLPRCPLGFPVPLVDERSEKPVGIVRAAIRHRLGCLSEDEPGGQVHGLGTASGSGGE